MELSDSEGEVLVRLARHAIAEFLAKQSKVPVPPDIPSSLLQKAGVFVTLLEGASSTWELRGCIGRPYPNMALAEATIDAALDAACGDPRFYPITQDELGNILVEVSVLTPPALVKVRSPLEYPKHIEVGRDGLIIESRVGGGLLLPQVAVEQGWDEQTFLSQACMKAGLMPDAWLTPHVKVYRFQATVFGEVEPHGPVRRKGLTREG